VSNVVLAVGWGLNPWDDRANAIMITRGSLGPSLPWEVARQLRHDATVEEQQAAWIFWVHAGWWEVGS
jgi:hypothetical protein